MSRRRLDGGAGEPGTPAPPAPGAATSALAARSVSVSLGGRRAVDSVSLAVERGEWLSLIGPNGAGKTTLLRAIAGLVRYDGEIELGGVAARRLGRREVARRVAVVPQAPLMPAGMGVREYVLLGRTPYVSYTGKEGFGDHAAAERALRRLDLDGLAERQLGSLSGGERQRAVLARALAQEAPLLLLDEVSLGLAPVAVDGVYRSLEKLIESGATILLVEQDLGRALKVASRITCMLEGRIVLEGTPGELTRERVTEAYFGLKRSVAAG